MAVVQLSVFVENKPKALSDLIKVMAQEKINIRAMSIADTTDFNILRLIVSDTERGKAVLSEESAVTCNEVVAVKMDDKAGALYEILGALGDADINIEYMYAFTAPTPEGAYVVLRVDDVTAAEKVLSGKGLVLLNHADIANM